MTRRRRSLTAWLATLGLAGLTGPAAAQPAQTVIWSGFPAGGLGDQVARLRAQNNPIPTYDQNTINNFTKVFTGWRDCRATDPGASCPNATAGAPNYKDPMSLNPANHDLTAKTLLSYPGSTTTNIAAMAPNIHVSAQSSAAPHTASSPKATARGPHATALATR